MRIHVLTSALVATSFSFTAFATAPKKVGTTVAASKVPAAPAAAKPATNMTTPPTSTVPAQQSAPVMVAQAPTVVSDSSYGGSSNLPFSITATFPGGGSQPIGNALGGRMKLNPAMYVSALLVFSSNTDNTKDKSLFGLAGKFQYMLGSSEKRARPYGAGQLYVWKPGGDANKPNDKMAFGLSGAVGAEVFFIPELSAFAETGVFIRTSHVDKSETELGTFMSAIGVNFNFGL